MQIEQRILKKIWRRNRRGKGCKRWQMNPLDRYYLEALRIDGAIVLNTFGEMWVSIDPDMRGHSVYMDWRSQEQIDLEYIRRDRRGEFTFQIKIYSLIIVPVAFILALGVIGSYIDGNSSKRTDCDCCTTTH